jgi:hypothetical protein
LSFKVVVLRASRSWCEVNVDGKKKVMKKQRRSKGKSKEEGEGKSKDGV